ncbi:MAG: potassium-transporting ATPase subunit KdpC [Vicinamibacterales bacterium]
MFKELTRAALFTAVTMLLCGGAYPLLIWGIGQTLFAERANGSLIRRADGTVIGSRLVAQPFTRTEYFRPRPSAVDYDAASTGGSNLGSSNPEHLMAVEDRLAEVMKREGVDAAQVPADLVTASGAGLDPHISPAAAAIQAPRVAAARGVPVDAVRALIAEHTEPPTFGFLGRPRVNVLELNLALDAQLASSVASQ